VLLSPAARRHAALPPATFDPFLEGCSAVSEVAGFELTSLLQVLARRDGAAAPPVALQLHVGDLAPGDGVEAELLSDAVWAGGGGGRSEAGVSVELVRHAGAATTYWGTCGTRGSWTRCCAPLRMGPSPSSANLAYTCACTCALPRGGLTYSPLKGKIFLRS